jgi:hypothetical protein
MAGGWDPSLVDPTDVVFDGLILRSVGGRTGEVTLENGQQIRFPFKAQQEITSSVPPTIKTEEVGGANHYLHSTYSGGSFPTVHDRGPFLRFISGFPDDASPSSVADLASGQVTGQSEALIRLTSSPTTGEIYVFGNTSFVDSVNLAVISTLGTISITAGDDITISTTGAGDTILIDSADTLTLNSAGLMTLQPDANQNLALTTTGTGDVNITAGDDINLAATGDVVIDSGSSAVVTANAGNDRAVRANGYPLVPLRNVGTAISGTAPAVSDAAPAYKFQAGKATVTFTAGAGTLTFPTAFATGLLACLVTSGGSDAVVDVTMGSSTKTSAALTLYIAGAAATGGADVTYIAIGW